VTAAAPEPTARGADAASDADPSATLVLDGPQPIGVVSDTHIDRMDDVGRLGRLWAGPFAGIKWLLHAGDLGLYAWWHTALPDGVTLVAVRGNCDASDSGFPWRRIVSVAGRRVGLVHGEGAPDGVRERAAKAFAGDRVDAVVFGHTHEPYLATHGGVTYFNPGSPTAPRGDRASAGLLIVADGRWQWRHVFW
jgi:putative phosphoesterase